MAPTTIHLLRHGEVHNPQGILYGRLPGFHLSDRGRAMADRIAGVLGDGTRDIRAIVSSPLERAQETAAPTAAALGLGVALDERVLEAANTFEGMQVSKSTLARPSMLKRVWNPFRPSWGEPYAAQALRVRAAVASLLPRVEGGEGLIVSHQLPIWVTRLQAEHRRLWHDPRKRECTLASITSLRFDGGALVSVEYREPAADLIVGVKAVPGA